MTLFNLEPVPQELVAAATGRTNSLFAKTVAEAEQKLTTAICNRDILVIGAAGSIGRAVTMQLLPYRPRRLVLADINENSLADLVRELRTGTVQLPAELTTSICAIGTVGFERFLESQGAFDAVLNLAAIKHVRSERDCFGLVRMLETNVFGLDQVFRHLRPGDAQRVFSVSTDKAVNPVNMMGASKRWMERVIAAAPDHIQSTSARFANVAFSAGSLPNAFANRLTAKQPIIAPCDIRRYFISHEEAGHLCLLSAFLGENCELLVPKLDTRRNAVAFTTLATKFLEFHGLKPVIFTSEQDARNSPLLRQSHPDEWPCFFPVSDTTGEKEIEDLTYASEQKNEDRYADLTVVKLAEANRAALDEARERYHAFVQGRSWTKSALVDIVRLAVPELKHEELGRYLDEKA